MEIIILLFLIVFAALPLFASKNRNGRYAIADIGLLILPPLCLLAGFKTLNSPALTGWAYLVYPVACSIICILILNVRVYIFEKFFSFNQLISVTVLVIACALAFFFGATAAPLYVHK
jgi:hypothetical protein